MTALVVVCIPRRRSYGGDIGGAFRHDVHDLFSDDLFHLKC